MFIRLILSGLAVVAWVAVNGVFNNAATLASGKSAGSQFQNSDTAYLVNEAIQRSLSTTGLLMMLALVVALIVIWWAPGRRWVAQLMAALSVVALVVFPAHAYWDTSDKAEAYTILPNETAFWIPDVGANKTSQVQLDSEAYLNENKVSTKRFVIPHKKFENSGGWAGWDDYVPTGRLIILSRKPFSREWVAASNRGTSKLDESIPCQSREGLNIAVGVSVGASISEANAAKFLYRFGILPPAGDRWDPKVIFTSVYYGRDLESVMDDIGRKAIQTMICREIAARGFDQDNAEANAIMDTVTKEATPYFAGMGITLEFMGWADTFTFDRDVQKAVNDRYRADKLGQVLPLLQALAQLQVQEGLGSGLDKHGLPIVVTPDMLHALEGMVRQAPPAVGR